MFLEKNDNVCKNFIKFGGIIDSDRWIWIYIK